MARYVVLLDWTDQGVRNAKESANRVRQAWAAFQPMGITFETIYWTLGTLTVAGGSSALAGHGHYLETPGTCIEDIAGGQTSQTSGGGAHQFHDHVHKGTPGVEAFTNPSNPVSIDKVTATTGC